MKRHAWLLVLLLVAAPVSAQVPGGDFHAWFLSQVAGKPFGQQTLLAIAPLLPCVGSKITPPNADGERTKVWDPIAEAWTRVGFGEGGWVWVRQAPAAPPVITSQDLAQCENKTPTTPTELPSVALDLSAVYARLESITAQNERIYLDEVNRLNALSDQLKVHDEKLNQILAFLGNAKVIVAEVGVIVGWALEHYVINPKQ